MAMTNIEDYIKDLSPEMQEKAKACKDLNELLILADENDLELPVDALQGVAGGCGGDECEGGGSHEWKTVEADAYSTTYKCKKCGSKKIISNLK